MLFSCAVCGAAEQALPTNGAEVAFDGRKRATLDVRAASFRTKEGRELSEVRVEPGAAAALAPSTMLAVGVPVVQRTQTTLGDVEVRLDRTLTRSIGRHVSFDGGMKFPTAPADRSLPPDLQVGCSSLVPFVGLTAASSGSLLSFWTSLAVYMPFAVGTTTAPHPGDSLRASASLQMQPARVFATRLGAFARWDSTGELDGAGVRESGGAAVHVAPEIVVSPIGDLVISAGAAFPVVQAMRAYRSTSPVLLASAGFDF